MLTSKALLLALTAAPALASPVAGADRLFRRQEAANETSSSSSAVLADLSVLNALAFPFDRTGADNATVGNVSLPSSPTYQYGSQASVPAAEEKLARVRNATFVAYQDAFLQLAGNATLERAFQGGNYHEAPVYLPTRNQIFLTGDNGASQYIVDLNSSSVHNFTADPPVENVNGATYHDGVLYLVSNGGIGTAAGVYAVNVETNKSSIVVNNYYGLRFKFTDATYGQLMDVNPYYPQMQTGVYIYNSTTKLTKLIVNQVVQPNGLALSPDASVFYVGDTGALAGPNDPHEAGPRVVYAFDVLDGAFATNRRVFHLSPQGVPDGMKVDTEGRLWTVLGGADTAGVQVVGTDGQLLGLIQLPEGGQAYNLMFQAPEEGAEGDTLWVVGGDSIWKIVGLNVTGLRAK
ncbi:hypothetical protein JCM10213_008116 [Rhodosporidiobolus nylandii]